MLRSILTLSLALTAADAHAVLEELTDCFSVSRLREIRCMIRSNLHFGPHLGLSVNRETILAVKTELNDGDIELLLDLLTDEDRRIALASRQLLAEFGETGYLKLTERFQSTDPLRHPLQRASLLQAADRFRLVRPDLYQADDFAYPPSGSIQPLMRREDGQQRLTVPYSPDSTGRLKIDENAFRLSTATGGLYYFWAPGEFGSVSGAVAATGKKLAYAFGDADRNPENLDTPLTVPVVAGTRKLDVFTGAQRIENVLLTTPSGRNVEDLPVKIRIYKLKYMYIVHIDRPEPGNWRLAFKGVGKYLLSARGD
ncbi:MAG: hypothetical protein ACU826_04515 [Gammaproteobacteria bacterium]